jgi:hypothetical protein
VAGHSAEYRTRSIAEEIDVPALNKGFEVLNPRLGKLLGIDARRRAYLRVSK